MKLHLYYFFDNINLCLFHGGGVIITNSKIKSIPTIIFTKRKYLKRSYLIGKGDESFVYNYLNKYAVKIYKNNLYNKYQLEEKFKKMRLLTYIKDKSFCFPIGFTMSDDYSFNGFFTELISNKTKIKEFTDLGNLKDNLRILKYIIEADEALKRIHKKGIIIGDIKENNIMIDQNDNIKYIDTDNYQYQNYDFDLFPSRANSFKKMYGINSNLKDNDKLIFSLMALRLLTKNSFFDYTTDRYSLSCLLNEINFSKEVREGLKIIFSDAIDKPYISSILKNEDKGKILNLSKYSMY